MSGSSVISIIFWIFFIIKVVIPILKKAEGNLKDTTNSATFKKVRQQQNNFSIDNSYYMQHKPIKRNNLKGLMEDRTSDWLAKQLREEQYAQKVVSDMFQLKQLHREHCDAHALREEHFNNCDAEEVRQSKQKMTQAEMDRLKNEIKQRHN